MVTTCPHGAVVNAQHLYDLRTCNAEIPGSTPGEGIFLFRSFLTHLHATCAKEIRGNSQQIRMCVVDHGAHWPPVPYIGCHAIVRLSGWAVDLVQLLQLHGVKHIQLSITSRVLYSSTIMTSPLPMGCPFSILSARYSTPTSRL